MWGNTVRRGVVVLITTLGLALANPAWAADDYASTDTPSAGAMAVDALLVRPLGLVATVLGTGLFIVSLPFSLTGMNVEKADQRLIVEPARYTFQRPLGNFQAKSPVDE